MPNWIKIRFTKPDSIGDQDRFFRALSYMARGHVSYEGCVGDTEVILNYRLRPSLRRFTRSMEIAGFVVHQQFSDFCLVRRDAQ